MPPGRSPCGESRRTDVRPGQRTRRPAAFACHSRPMERISAGYTPRYRKGLMRGHVEGAETSVRLHQDGHLAAVAAGPVRDPADVHHRVHGLVGHLGGPLVVPLDRREVNGDEPRSGPARALAQVRRQPVAQRRHPAADAGVRACPSRAVLRASSARRKARGRRAVSRPPRPCRRPSGAPASARSSGPPGVGSAHRSSSREVAGDLVDPPGAGGVGGSGKSHQSGPLSIRWRIDRA